MRRAGMADYGRFAFAGVLLFVGASSLCQGQATLAPASPSYSAVVRTIDNVHKDWEAKAPETAPGWNSFFDEIQKEIKAYNAAKTASDRLGPLNRLWQLSVALEGVAWDPATELRESLRAWLRPRVRLATAEQNLNEALAQNVTSPEDAQNRKDWRSFIDDKLGAALKNYEGAPSVQARQDAVKKLRTALDSLRHTNPWSYSSELQAAADDLFNAPNLDIAADTNALYPVFANQVVVSGPVYRRGYVSQVTAGPYAGFALAPSNEGIAFTNSQYLTSVTPITDFNQQMARDPRGQRATKLYSFGATQTDSGYMSVTAMITPTGFHLFQAPSHNFDARICSTPAAGGGFGRLVAGMIGMGQQKITNKVYEGAIGRMRSEAAVEANAEASERMAAAEADENAKLKKFFPGDGSLTVNNITVAGLSLKTTSANALVSGVLKWTTNPQGGGADAPQPAKFAQPAAGVSADIHLTSVGNNLIAGYLSSPEAASVDNLVIEARKVEPGMKPSEAIKVTKNVDFATYLKRVDETAAQNNPNVQVIRIKKPKSAPELAADANGRLVVIVHDFQLDLPVPPQVAKSGLGSPAKVYRLVATAAEFVFELKPVTEPDGSIRLTGNLKEFTPAAGSKVYAINDNEAKALPLDPFRSVFIFQGFATAIKAKPLNVPLENVKLKGYNIASISELDPSGWMRIVLTPTGERPLAEGAGG